MVVCILGRSHDEQCYLATRHEMQSQAVSNPSRGNQHNAFRTNPIRANWSTQDASKSADIKRCARSGPDYLEPKGLPAELKELSWTESATLGYKHTIWIQRILPANRDRALGYKTTPLKPRGENGLAVIQILQVIMTIANIEWLNLTFKRRRDG